MRNNRFDRLLAGTVLSAAIAVPSLAIAQQDRVESVRPLPPSLNGQMLRQRDVPPPPPPQHYQAPAQLPQRDAAPVPPARAVATPVSAARDAESATVEIKGAANKAMAASDTAVVDRLRAIVTSKQLDKRIANAGDRKAVETFYAARNYAPVWVRDGQVTPQARAAMTRLKNAAADGLDAQDYPAPDFAGSA